MKEIKLKYWSFDIGNFTYKIPKDKQKEILYSKEQDLLIKYSMYIITQNSRGIDHYLPLEFFTKVYEKAKKASKSTLKEYGETLLKEHLLETLSVYTNHLYQNKSEVTFISSYNPNNKIKYKFVTEDIVEIEEVTELETLKKFNKDYELDIYTKHPLLVFIDKALEYKYYPIESNIYQYCRNLSADLNSALNLIYDTRGIKYKV